MKSLVVKKNGHVDEIFMMSTPLEWLVIDKALQKYAEAEDTPDTDKYVVEMIWRSEVAVSEDKNDSEEEDG